MVRTKADAATAKVSGAKAPRKVAVTQPPADNKKRFNTGVGGNPYCPRETPAWQKEITNFFQKVGTKEGEEDKPAEAPEDPGVTMAEEAGCSSQDCNIDAEASSSCAEETASTSQQESEVEGSSSVAE